MKKHFNGQPAAVAGLPPPPGFRLRQGFGGQVGGTNWHEKTARRVENGQLSPEPSSCQKSGCALFPKNPTIRLANWAGCS
jgi:hypothetical protein